MWSRILLIMMLGSASAAGAQSVTELRHPEPELSSFQMSPEMKAARASFPVFVKELRDSPWDAKIEGRNVVTELAPDNPGNDDCCHAVKVLIPVGVGFETAWVMHVSIVEDDKFEGTMQYAIGIASLSAGDRIRFSALHVADWRYSLYEQTYGGYRLRVDMDPPPVAKFLEGDFAPLPEIK